MPKVTLRQGIYIGALKEKTHVYHGIPYARPFTKRFELPQPLPESNEESSAADLASNCPQLPSRLAFLNGNWYSSTKYDEKACAVLSVYAPENAGSAEPLPVIVWVHGGAWVTGGSQISNYDGTKLAQDAGAIVVCINYRLGALGFLYHESRSLDNGADLPAGIADVVAAFEWVGANIHAFGGDPSNVTSIGQSAGAYNTQALLARRPDLLHKAVIISSPAGITTSPSSAAKIRDELITYLPDHSVPETVPIEVLLQAQRPVMAANPGILAPWAPTASIIPGFDRPESPAGSKQILIGWTATDGKAFSHMASPGTPVSQLNNVLTDQIFRDPSIALAKQLREQGHAVTTFELTWAPEGFAFGPTHCIDLPLTFGFEAWSRSAMCSEKDRDEWEARGKRWRQRLGDFARDGAPFVSEDGIEVF
jgi:para-nitrobenzyl esterase